MWKKKYYLLFFCYTVHKCTHKKKKIRKCANRIYILNENRFTARGSFQNTTNQNAKKNVNRFFGKIVVAILFNRIKLLLNVVKCENVCYIILFATRTEYMQKRRRTKSLELNLSILCAYLSL